MFDFLYAAANLKHRCPGMQTYQLLRFVSWRAFGFWSAISFATNTLLLAAFVLRVVGMTRGVGHGSETLRLRSFQVLSFVAPFIWLVLDSSLLCQLRIE
jgi:hypothetical protein